ncbi:MAG: hypothetical protein KJ667_09880 [Alphaproteobacteria bacterium]|nr:hypothetical protein [Alphaproteobacteria bacterium]
MTGKDEDKEIWRVIRQDTHGNEFEVAASLPKKKAESIAAEFNAKGHKQTYWAQTEPPRPLPF